MSHEPDHLISVSAAARALGLKRRDVQTTIRDGRLTTFEGNIRVSDLHEAFPNFQPAIHLKLAQCENIKLQAGVGSTSELASAGTEALEREVIRLRRQVSQLEAELGQQMGLAERSANVVVQLREKMREMQEHCDRRQAMILGTLSSWLIAHSAERQR